MVKTLNSDSAIDTAIVTEAKENLTNPFQLIRIQVDDTAGNDLLLTNYINDIVYSIDGTTANEKTYTATSQLGSINFISEEMNINRSSVNITLNNMPKSTLTSLEASNINAIGGIVTIFQGFQNATSSNVYQKWKGVISNFSLVEQFNSKKSATIIIECENIIGYILDTRGGRYTSAASFDTSEYNNDKSMEFVASLTNFNPFFGKEDEE